MQDAECKEPSGARSRLAESLCVAINLEISEIEPRGRSLVGVNRIASNSSSLQDAKPQDAEAFSGGPLNPLAISNLRDFAMNAGPLQSGRP